MPLFPDSLVARVKKVLQGESLALMLFGSVARGDEGTHSDTDILQVTHQYRRTYKAGEFNVSVYTPQSLEKAASKGSLFVLHLITEGVVLEDPQAILTGCLSKYVPPQNYECLLCELRLATNLLNVTPNFYKSHWERCNKMALFILRSALFAFAATEGRPTFSIPSIAAWQEDERIYEAYQLKYRMQPDLSLYWLCSRLAQEYLHAEFSTEPDAAESIVVNAYGQSDLVVALGLRLIGAAESTGYGEGAS
jgi:hypothetical protein